MSASKWELSFRAVTLGKFQTCWYETYLNPSQKHPWNPVSQNVPNHLPDSFSVFTPYTYRQKFLTKIFIWLVNQLYFITFFCKCMYVHMHAHTFVGLYMGGWRLTWVCSSTAFHSIYWSKVPWWSWNFQIWLRSPASLPQGSPVFISQSLGLPTWFLCNCWRP